MPADQVDVVTARATEVLEEAGLTDVMDGDGDGLDIEGREPGASSTARRPP